MAVQRVGMRGAALALAAVAAMAMTAAPAQAAEPVVVHERWVDVLGGTSLICGGTTLEYSGRVATNIHIVEPPSGGFHVSISWHSMGVTAVAADGTVYHDMTNGMETKGATDDWVADDGTGTFTENARERIRVFAPGGDSVLLTSDMTFHITKVDGELRVVRDSYVASCSG